ncbi:beta-ketoacyl synthase [Oceanospirillum linum]|uniref:Beta-ketoacyl synthase n=1 Tax=Oceanospirillum linum TaxID=966 RepID=A0A1T1H896_OCELI|nr:beta-ketoacyl synthase [Oceanospirillum linum]OOV86099.1 beta-ketoacyl synthase [Oceanospirillum linum]SEG42035.1 3-oxoacyl-(acyl-carrier-protein) synthase [Oleiphilus messinensis]SMP33328.1 acetoacetyl-[acyl-carrier protein] synthase [Oceanospirillum linum]
MSQLPVIIGFGGVNAAGRSSGFQSFRRTVLNNLDSEQQAQTLVSLACMMGLLTEKEGQWITSEGESLDLNTAASKVRPQVLNNTLIRKTHPDLFDVDAIPANARITIKPDQEAISFTLRPRQMPETTPDNWQVTALDNGHYQITITGDFDALIPDGREAGVKASAQIPTGFNPGKYYRSVHHPRGLQMAVFAASDMLGSTGLDWDAVKDTLRPDQMAVYAGNSIGQLDQYGWGGLLQSFVNGKRATSKQMPLGYGQMPADFINAYVLGSVGATAGHLGACASFLYNLQAAVTDIRLGRRRLAVVGTSDAPVTPEVIEGFRVMGALADDASLMALDALEKLTDADYQKACRPFAENCGFTMAEGAQYLMLTDDTLALELGAQIFGSVPEVFVNADGFKKSISAPGIGNYVTLAKSAALVRSVLGEESLRQRSYVHAHGTSTPKNRVTESHVLNQVAKAFDITSWPVAAIKCYVGHSQGTAAGDQTISALGTWAHQMIPGIATTDKIADDVHQSHLEFSQQAIDLTERPMDTAFINAKGFGGNNATGVIFSPEVTLQMLTKKHGQTAISAWEAKVQQQKARAEEYQENVDAGRFSVVYHFGDREVLEGPELQITDRKLHIPGYAQDVSLELDNPFADMS